MENRKVLICAPVREREYIIKEYLQGILELTYPKCFISIYWIVNDSTDSTLQILNEFRDNNISNYKDIKIDIINFGAPEDARTSIRRKSTFYTLATLRNKLLEYFLATDNEYLFSIDSDIVVQHDCLSQLLIDDKDVISAYVCNEIKKGRRGNALNIFRTEIQDENKNYIMGSSHIDVSTMLEIFECSLTGACYIIKRKVIESGARYAYGLAGEDMPFCLDVKKNGFNMFCRKSINGKILAEHKMYDLQRLRNAQKIRSV